MMHHKTVRNSHVFLLVLEMAPAMSGNLMILPKLMVKELCIKEEFYPGKLWEMSGSPLEKIY